MIPHQGTFTLNNQEAWHMLFESRRIRSYKYYDLIVKAPISAIVQVMRMENLNLLRVQIFICMQQVQKLLLLRIGMFQDELNPGDSFKMNCLLASLATVGTSYAGKVIGPDLGGLAVQGRMSVGHLTSVSTGTTFFSKGFT